MYFKGSKINLGKSLYSVPLRYLNMSLYKFTSIEDLKQICKDVFDELLLETSSNINYQICQTAKSGESKCIYKFDLTKQTFNVILVDTIVKALKNNGYSVKILNCYTIEICWSDKWNIDEILS